MSKKLEIIINEAIKKANELRHEYLTLEGVLLAMLDDEEVIDVLKACGADLKEIEIELMQFLDDATNFSILSDSQIQELSEKQFVDEELRKLAADSGIQYQPEISLSLQRVIQRAAIHVQSAGKRQIKGINLLVALFQEKESFALYLLHKQGIERFDVVKAIAHGVDEPITSEADEVDLIEHEAEEGDSHKKKKETALEEFSINLNKLAEKNKIDPLIGRQEEITRIIETLCRRRKNNPLLVGEAGVGKTAIAEGLAFAIVNDAVPEVLEGTTIFSLDMAALLAGAKFRGDFEQRLKGVIRELEKRNDRGDKTILFIDEIHTVMGAGATTGGSMDASNLLKPALSAGRIRCMGSTTHEEYRKFIEKDHAFSRRFQKIDIDEPSIEDTYKILKGLKPRFEEHHGVKYPNTVLKAAVDLAEKYISDRKNPDKSLDVIDEAGARIQLLPASKRKSSISKKDVEQVVAKLARIPEVSVESNEKVKLKSLKENLGLLIYGQDEAVSKVSDAILMSRSGLGHEDKPMASFLFAGPTGVGKTELARQLGIQLGSHLERFDMSEYMEKHTVSKLIGAPPGYVGYESGGLLTDAVKKHPHCILLLDEIEKAHPDIFNILLQVMDHGVLTDAQGRSTDFRNVVIIMTTNAGAREMDSGSIGLGSNTNVNVNRRDQRIKQYFSPEFRNRLDSIIHFNKLDDQFLVQIVEKFLMQLESKLSTKNVEIEVSESAKLWLAKEGFDPKMGARPIARLIDQKLKKPLSTEVLFGELEKGGKVKVDIVNDEISFQFS
ncbi:ATP-dependent Clp protease ATP-binding subunit ClpA [Halobacteriovorax sp. GB3]|uniref:ATP-dependent Clp protease ATP-binding subunit ClpA n=1 Tax=Halobacteriovorax sp. GB3 TaxID=2719615 RepID=UPI0023600EF8|nr:ATP-dependent Clp protease ATP-binding subunit ClpA [Halobacteriovorax sp. GB3]MDD0853821.1 ATP-dependent Clp protease ATP-binding subunit ClpA [Halobacteriovorax sp. GB3]